MRGGGAILKEGREGGVKSFGPLKKFSENSSNRPENKYGNIG